MNEWNSTRKRYIFVLIGMALLLLVLTVLNISEGSTEIPLREALRVLRMGDATDTEYAIIHDIRLPRIAAAIVMGGALSVSGFLLQVFFANPIAGPYVLGISSGAKLTVALTMILLLGRGYVISAAGMVAAAFAGSLISMGVVLLLAGKVRNMSLLVVCGVMIGYICSAATDLLVTFADDSNIVNLHNWSLGSFSGIRWNQIALAALLIASGTVLAFLLSKPMDAYRLGEGYAVSVGVHIRGLRIGLILISSMLSATVTAFAGPVSFVGIAVPHLVRGVMRTARPIWMIPSCFLGGAIVTLLCDGIARTLFAPTELSISSVTAVLLAPVVIALMVRRRK